MLLQLIPRYFCVLLFCNRWLDGLVKKKSAISSSAMIRGEMFCPSPRAGFDVRARFDVRAGFDVGRLPPTVGLTSKAYAPGWKVPRPLVTKRREPPQTSIDRIGCQAEIPSPREPLFVLRCCFHSLPFATFPLSYSYSIIVFTVTRTINNNDRDLII